MYQWREGGAEREIMINEGYYRSIKIGNAADQRDSAMLPSRLKKRPGLLKARAV